ncbi:acyl carrier protein [Methylovorus glucosotrophus]|uniref:Acyl carrier protein-related protein n=1 Tax=Methylovorus glucosotrophus (strain SIP3-4) TaxID=582744 RepID=C6XBQ3_METGS|nr:acyl carrier protein [Methylovorus glucosotrophus]ACT52023.1 acyl carrier protein-related protein [Methylovorus glucosotrophus SIP3-4]
MDSIEDFIEKFNGAVDFQEPVEITANTQLHTLPEWDSLAALGVIVMFSMEYNKTISGENLKNCNTIADLHALSA